MFVIDLNMLTYEQNTDQLAWIIGSAVVDIGQTTFMGWKASVLF